ncbi:Hypothetical protein I596_3557 [Dokdonella koreensis DS-123]|uniref:Uncharacterized protein n=1 Tax=Dokdonella koreensis DS-123 TaxID=1300342 RepID=A0A160DXS0_9GAMM|nr:Hypothetical protein I596_3557 [Dokdonella koreensis DS-123]
MPAHPYSIKAAFVSRKTVVPAVPGAGDHALDRVGPAP